MKIDPEKLKPKLDLEGKYVDFYIIRAALSVYTLFRDDQDLSAPNEDGECRGRCPKCNKDRSFALNINKNRFNCFNKGCDLKGGGVIDFASKLYGLPAKEAAHLLARAYGISPYTADDSGAGETVVENKIEETPEPVPDYIPRAEFENLRKRLDRLSNIVFCYMLEQEDDLLDKFTSEEYEHTLTH